MIEKNAEAYLSLSLKIMWMMKLTVIPYILNVENSHMDRIWVNYDTNGKKILIYKNYHILIFKKFII